MIDIQLIRNSPDLVRKALAKKKCDLGLLDQVIEVDARRKELRQDIEGRQAELNKQSVEMSKISPDEREKMRGPLKETSDGIKKDNELLVELDQKYLVLMRQIPNIPADDVPDGATDKENVVLRQEGVKREFNFPVKDHEQLAMDLDLLDMAAGARTVGAKAYYLKNELVILELAVMRFALDVLRSKGFTVMTVPVFAKAEGMYGAGHFSSPEDEINGDAYRLERDDLFVTGTAEVGLANYHAGEILRESDLTMRYTGISTCFRREAGTYGKETRGLYRVHQFNKVEMFCLTRPEDSWKEHELLLSIAEDLLQKLGLPYRVVVNCGGDLGQPQAKKYDIETWMPGMGKYGETHSCSNDTDYQARTLGIRFRRSGGGNEKEIEYVHTLNNTAFASPRILIPILENYQQEDGSVEIPEVLIPYTGFSRISKKD